MTSLIQSKSTCCHQIYPREYEGHFGNLMVTREEILDRTKALAAMIHQDFKGTRPVMVCVLKGANPVSGIS